MTYKQLQHELKRDKEKVNKDKREGKQERLLGYRRLWLDKGPIWFAENVLTCPTDVSLTQTTIQTTIPIFFVKDVVKSILSFVMVEYHIMWFFLITKNNF